MQEAQAPAHQATTATTERAAHSQLLKIAEVQRRTQLSRASIYNYVNAGKFPPPVKLGAHSRWVESEVEQYIGRLMAARTPA